MGSYVKCAIILTLSQLAISATLESRAYMPDTVDDSTQYPFMVAIMEKNYFRGSGVILREDIVVASAHIVCNLKNVVIIAGRTLLDPSAEKAQYSRVEKIVPHGAYGCNHQHTYTFDIAILVLEDDLEFTDNVNAIGLPNAFSSVFFVNKLAIVAGWARTAAAERPTNNLLAANLTILSDPECHGKSVGVLEMNDDGICAVDLSKSGKGVCWGETGSALFIASDDPAYNYTLLGLASDVFTRTGKCQVQFPSPFASALYLKKFIETATLGNQRF